MLDFDTISKVLKGHELVREVDRVPRGHIRIETALLYPDASSVDLFVVSEKGLFDYQKLSDLGQTTSWLMDVQVKPWLSKKRQRFLEDAIRVYGVLQRGGSLEKTIDSDDQLIDCILSVGQACVRVADLAYTRRNSLQTAFSEDVEELLCDLDAPFENAVDLPGKQGKPVRVDYVVTGASTRSAVLAWSSANASSAHVQSNEIFRKWYDLTAPTWQSQRVTILNDQFDVYREEDIARIRDFSDIVSFSDKMSLRELLTA